MVLLLLYLVPVTARSGQTSASVCRTCEAQVDGSVPGGRCTARSAFAAGRDGALTLPRSPCAGGRAVGMVGWVSHANRQGLPRRGKTIVVEA